MISIKQLVTLVLKQSSEQGNVQRTFLTKAWNCSARTASASLSQAAVPGFGSSAALPQSRELPGNNIHVDLQTIHSKYKSVLMA